MADDPATPTGQEPPDNGQESTTPNPIPPADDFDKDRAMATIAKLRDFEKLSRTQARELEALKQQIKAHDDAKLSDVEKRDARIAELESQNADLLLRHQQATVRNAVATAASRHGAVYPDAAYKLIDLADVEYDSDGAPTNVDRLLADAKKAYPLLFRNPSGSADGASGGAPAVPGASMDAYIRKAAGIT